MAPVVACNVRPVPTQTECVKRASPHKECYGGEARFDEVIFSEIRSHWRACAGTAFEALRKQNSQGVTCKKEVPHVIAIVLRSVSVDQTDTSIFIRLYCLEA